jgi:CubicO group peptidase (beta-lactamase class C family)
MTQSRSRSVLLGVALALTGCVADELDELDELDVSTTTEELGSPMPAYAGIFRRASTSEQHVIGLTWSSFVSQWQTKSAAGLRLNDLEVYFVNGVQLFDGVFEPGTDGYYLWAGSDDVQLQAKITELSASGLRMVDVASYMDVGGRRWVGVWRSGAGNQIVRLADSQFAFQVKAAAAASLGLQPTTIEVVDDAGTLKYSGIFRPGTDSAQVLYASSWNALSDRWLALSRTGYRLADAHAVISNGKRLYAAVFRAGSDDHDLVSASSVTAFERKATVLRQRGLALSRMIYDPGEALPPAPFAAALLPLDDHTIGYSYAIVDDLGLVNAEGGVGWARGPLDGSVPMTANQRVQLASMSKTITAVALMRVVELYGINIEAPFYPLVASRLPNPAPGVAAVTVRQLLTHRSGMAGNCSPLWPSMQQLISSPMIAPAGTPSYQNSNYCLLRAIIESVTGQNYVDFVKKEVFARISLTGPSCTPEPVNATLYYPDQAAGVAGGAFGDQSGDCSASGWYMSASQYAKFINGLRVILTNASYRTMVDGQFAYVTQESQRGMTWGMNGHGIGASFECQGAYVSGAQNITAVLLLNSPGPWLDASRIFDGWRALVDGLDNMQPSLSRGKPTTQSTTFLEAGRDFSARKAVDGVLGQRKVDNNISLTNYDSASWWKVDLGTVRTITGVDLWNIDYSPLAFFDIQISSDDVTWTTYPFPIVAGRFTNLTTNTLGRFVRVRLQVEGYLGLGEVNVWGY